MSEIDFAIVALYIVGLLAFGVALARKAGRSSESYFLGDRRMPWWALGASGMTSNLDAAGTMTIVTLLYLYGVHGFFIEMRGGVVLPIAVFLAFMGKWHQRSQVVTTAEWMRLRFGDGLGGKSARFLAALTYLVITIGMIVFFLAAAGTFFSVFLPFSPAACAVAVAMVALVYTMLSGLYGVVWTDVFQAILIGAAAIYVAVRAALLVDPALLAAWEGARFNTALPRLTDPALGNYEIFYAFFLAWMAKGVIEGLGGSGGSAYMAQRFYAARTPAECQKLAMLWVVLFSFRWPMALGFAIIGIHLGFGIEDPERVLPMALSSEFFPTGIRGLVVAAIIAASMSTFDSTINAGASYATRDVYLPLRPNAGPKEQVWVGYGASALIVATGLAIALTMTRSVVEVWTTIVIQLFPAFLVPFALRWFWGRFNGEGFSLGIVFGFSASTAVTFTAWGGALNEAQALGLIALVSLVGCLAGTFLFPAVDAQRLKTFFRQIRPAGLWPSDWKDPYRPELRANWLRLGVAVVWQVTTFMAPMFLLLGQWGTFLALAAIWGLALWGLLRLMEIDEPEEGVGGEG